jgi:hypothetical protein
VQRIVCGMCGQEFGKPDTTAVEADDAPNVCGDCTAKANAPPTQAKKK